MSDNKVQQAEGIVILIAGALVLYGVYKAAKVAGDAKDKVVATVSDIVGTVSDTVGSARRAVGNAYAETKTFFTGNQYYSPDALAGSMSKADAIKLSDEITARDTRMGIVDDFTTYPDPNEYTTGGKENAGQFAPEVRTPGASGHW